MSPMGGLSTAIVGLAGAGVCELQHHREVRVVSLSGSLAQAVGWCLCAVTGTAERRISTRVAETFRLPAQ